MHIISYNLCSALFRPRQDPQGLTIMSPNSMKNLQTSSSSASTYPSRLSKAPTNGRNSHGHTVGNLTLKHVSKTCTREGDKNVNICPVWTSNKCSRCWTAGPGPGLVTSREGHVIPVPSKPGAKQYICRNSSNITRLLLYYYSKLWLLIYYDVSFETSSRSELWEQIGISDVSDDVSVSVCLLESSQ